MKSTCNLLHLLLSRVFQLLALGLLGSFGTGCQLVDNSVKGTYSSPIESVPIGLEFDLDLCVSSPPEGLPYSCSLTATYVISASSSLKKDVFNSFFSNARSAAEPVTSVNYQTLANTCDGLTMDAQGQFSGTIQQVALATCSLQIRATAGSFIAEKSLTLTIAPSLTLSFDKENIFIQEGQGGTSFSLVLSEPAPYDSYFDFKIFGDTTSILSGDAITANRIYVLKGQSQVILDFSVPNGSSVGSPVLQQLRLTNGTSGSFPGISINTYASSTSLPNFDSLSVGSSHACGVSSGKLYCWGSNLSGQAGNGAASIDPIHTPLRIGSLTGWSQVATGTYHTCAIELGRLFCWGSDLDGQIGDGGGVTGTDVTTPLQIGISNQWSAISLGGNHSCGIDNGALYCWGEDDNGQIGDGSAASTPIDAPTSIGVSSLWTAVASGGDHTCGIDSGNLYCWGRDLSGRVGNGNASTNSVHAPELIGVETQWTEVAAGSRHTCGIENGGLYCWGYNSSRQIGIGDNQTDIHSPIQVGNSFAWSNIATGGSHTCGIQSGNLYCWGGDNAEQIGNGTGSSSSFVGTPTLIGTSSLWTDISAGYEFTCGINNIHLFCWGNDISGQLGNGLATQANVFQPIQVDSSNQWTQISAGGSHSCGVNSGHIYCWGSDYSQQIGNGPEASTDITLPLKIDPSNLWTFIKAGIYSSCAIKSGELFCWGRRAGGTFLEIDAFPIKVETSNAWASISIGNFHFCGLNNGELLCWGNESYGEIGNGFASSSIVPAPSKIGLSNQWTSISNGYYLTCGINSGELYCWGYNSDHQIGNGISVANVYDPLKIGSSTTWTHVAPGGEHTCGIDAGRLFCWGKDSNGMLGNGIGLGADVQIPTQIGSLATWTDITAGLDHTCGIESGKLFCWGDDTYQQQGDGSIALVDNHDPLQIGSSNLWTSVSAGIYHSCGINNGNIYCWGSNYQNAIGTRTDFAGSPFLVMEVQ